MLKLCKQPIVTYGVTNGYCQWDIEVLNKEYQLVTKVWIYKLVKFLIKDR